MGDFIMVVVMVVGFVAGALILAGAALRLLQGDSWRRY